jgi:hypothetical protein
MTYSDRKAIQRLGADAFATDISDGVAIANRFMNESRKAG